MISFMEMLLFTKLSFVKILRFQVRFQQHYYLLTPQCLFKERQACLSKECQSVEAECPPQGCISVEFLSQGSLVESDCHNLTPPGMNSPGLVSPRT